MYKYPFLDFNALNEKIAQNKIVSENKLSYIYQHLGGEYYDKEEKILKGAKACIVGVGGIPVEIKDDKLCFFGNPVEIEDIKKQLLKTMGLSATMSYLNPKNRELETIAQKTLDLGHKSIMHTVFLNILVVGHSIGVEHELSSQRDLMHLSRLTVADSRAQNSPCLTLLNGEQVELYKKVLDSTTRLIKGAEIPMTEETRNLLFPTAKSSMILLSGSLRNFEKLVALKETGGKEFEFCQILNDIEGLLDFIR